MKTKHQIATLAVLIAFAGCGPSDQSRSEKQTSTPSPTREARDQQNAAKEAAPVPASGNVPTPAYPPTVAGTELRVPAPPKETLSETKDEFITSMGKKLKDLDTRIAELAEKSKGYQNDAKAQADRALATLQEQRHNANQKFEEAKAAAVDAWKEMKGGVELALNQLETAYENAKSKFN